MSTIHELFAPKFLEDGQLTDASQRKMAEVLGADSLRYLPIDSVARSIDLDASWLCQACISGSYPTPAGERLYQIACGRSPENAVGRTYESVPAEVIS
jgi:amidophosphoribosyltransferase